MDDYMSRPANRAIHGVAVVLISMATCFASDCVLAEEKVHVVTIEAMRYVPEVIEVKAGDTVIWQNKDAFAHTATAVDRSFDSGSIASERNWQFRARRKGSISYVCTLHPTMKATLIVR
ncbi:cupredoxin family copper-binding protein [Noviherbaspirillum agri]